MEIKKILMILGAVALASIAYFAMQHCEKKEIDNVKIQSTAYYLYNKTGTGIYFYLFNSSKQGIASGPIAIGGNIAIPTGTCYAQAKSATGVTEVTSMTTLAANTSYNVNGKAGSSGWTITKA